MDTLLLAVYFLVVLYVLYQMALSLEDQQEEKVEILVEENTLSGQTQGQLELQGNTWNITSAVRKVGIKGQKGGRPCLKLIFDADKEMPLPPGAEEVWKKLGLDKDRFEDNELFQESLHPQITLQITPVNQQTLRAIPHLTLMVDNDTADMQVYLFWDRSSFEMMRQGSRVIRLTSNAPVDLLQAQVPTVINPGMMVTTNFTAENRFVRDPETRLVRPNPEPIVDLKERIGMSKLTDPTSGEDNIQGLYSVDLMVGIKHRTESDSKIIGLLVPFIYKIRIKVDEPAFPLIRWFLRNYGRRRPVKENWFWGSRPKDAK
jgi:hypothetical protein